MDERPVAFHDIPARKFPFTIQIIDDELGVVWEERIEGPCALEVPGFGPERSENRRCVITYGDGEQIFASFGDEDGSG